MSEVVPCFADGVVQDDESTTWGQRVAEEIAELAVNAVVCRYIRLVCKCAHHVQGDFFLRNEFVPEVDREGRVSSGEYCYEMPLEGLNRPFCLVRSFCERRHELVLNFLCDEVLVQTLRGFVVHDLELDVGPSL